MLKQILTGVALVASIGATSQEKIAQFETTHTSTSASNMPGMNAGNNSVELAYIFILYKDSLKMGMKHMDKRTLKQYKKQGIGRYQVIPGEFKQNENDMWVLQKEQQGQKMRVQVIPQKGEGEYSVRLSTKDDFTGNGTDQLFYNVKE